MLRVSWTSAALLDRVEPAAGLRDLRRDRGEVDDRAAARATRCGCTAFAIITALATFTFERLEPVRARRGEALVDVGAGEVDEEVDPAEALDGLRRRTLRSRRRRGCRSGRRARPRRARRRAARRPRRRCRRSRPARPRSRRPPTTASPISVAPPVTTAVLPLSPRISPPSDQFDFDSNPFRNGATARWKPLPCGRWI